MNERIKELMNQTGVPVSMPFDKWCEKFAELIVKECIQVAYAAERKPEGFLTIKSAHNLETEIYTHFGVKQ